MVGILNIYLMVFTMVEDTNISFVFAFTLPLLFVSYALPVLSIYKLDLHGCIIYRNIRYLKKKIAHHFYHFFVVVESEIIKNECDT